MIVAAGAIVTAMTVIATNESKDRVYRFIERPSPW
jgi:hypothetical protein